jgi:hypothetical protein
MGAAGDMNRQYHVLRDGHGRRGFSAGSDAACADRAALLESRFGHDSIGRFLALTTEIENREIDLSDLPPMEAGDVDAALTGSPTLGELEASRPWLVSGPAGGARQIHVRTARRAIAGQTGPVHLSKSVFRPAGAPIGTSLEWPLRFGLFTSSSEPPDLGMWHGYLRLCEQSLGGLQLFPRPWEYWHVSCAPDVRICEIQCAQDWVDLICSYPRHLSDGRVMPHWTQVADRYTALHFTPRAVISLDGFRFNIMGRESVPVYLTVESTLWLSWAFDKVVAIAGS